MGNLNAEEIINGLLQNDSTYVEDKECIRKAIRLIKELAEANATQIVTAIELDKQVERLTEENERLSTALANYDRQTEVRIAEEYVTAEAYDELREENERLTKQIEMSEAAYQELQFAFSICANQVKADTVREMQERLKEEPIKVGIPLFGLVTKFEVEYYANGLMLQMRDAIDRIANEMLNKNTEEEKK